MKNKTDIQTKNQQIDQILQEQYDAEIREYVKSFENVRIHYFMELLYVTI